MNKKIRVMTKPEDWLPNEEYNTLRSEMLERFERIFKLKTFGLISWAGVIGFYFKIEMNNYLALVILHLLVLYLISFIIRLQKSIYKIGSYLQANYETEMDVAWHVANRGFGEYAKNIYRPVTFQEVYTVSCEDLESDDKNNYKINVIKRGQRKASFFEKLKKLVFEDWGADNIQHGLLGLLMYVLSILVIFIKIGFHIPEMFGSIENSICTVVLIVLFFFNMFCLATVFGLVKEKEKSDVWKSYIQHLRSK